MQYVDRETIPKVIVKFDAPKRNVQITDNGRGMLLTDLQNFFVMHGENRDSQQGRRGGGRFGTGKSAAFGIAKVLTVTTVRDGKRSKVRLKKADILAANTGNNIPVQILEKEVDDKSTNGTVIELEDVFVRLDEEKLILFFERQLTRYNRSILVTVNGKECVRPEPSAQIEDTFEYFPEGAAKEALGDVKLVIKISRQWLEEPLRGIAIFSNGNFCEARPAQNNSHIFGHLDIPKLDEDSTDPPPFDSSRSLELNPNNVLVQAIYDFVDPKIEEVVRIDKDRRRKEAETEQAKKLRDHAQNIAELINNDLRSQQHRLPKSRKGYDLEALSGALTGAGDGTAIVPGIAIQATYSNLLGSSPGSNRHRAIDNGSIQSGKVSADKLKDAPGALAAKSVLGRGQNIPSLEGFCVEYQNLGVDADQSFYNAEKRTILINLDHPHLKEAIKGKSIDSSDFQRYALEVAISRYAIAVVSELIENGEDFFEMIEPIEFVSETVERLLRVSCASTKERP